MSRSLDEMVNDAENKSFETWAEMMGDGVMTTALLDRLLHHTRVYNLDGESYRTKKFKT